MKRKMVSVLSLWIILACLLCGCRAEKEAGDAQAGQAPSLPASIAEKLEQAENVVSTSGYLYGED